VPDLLKEIWEPMSNYKRPHPRTKKTSITVTNRLTKFTLVALAITGLSIHPTAEATPLKVYILAGQSNMEME